MAIVPPDPGIAVELAKTCDYDPVHKCFRRQSGVARDDLRFLRIEGDRVQATVVPERTISAETYAILQDGEVTTGNLIRSPHGRDGRLWLVVDTGFEITLAEVV